MRFDISQLNTSQIL